MAHQSDLTSALDLLATVSKGKMTITLEGRPFVRLDADERSLDVDADGLRAAGLHILDLAGDKEGMIAALTGSIHIANEMSDRGWMLTLHQRGEKMLTMGRGVSRLTGRIGLNPLKTRRLLKALR